MAERQNISSGAKWENIVGYSRAVRVGNVVEVSGTVAAEDDKVQGMGDPYAQTIFALQKVERALIEAGATMQDVVRTRIYVTDITNWEQVAEAHGEYFGNIKPATSMVQVSALIGEEYLVEIEATAIIT